MGVEWNACSYCEEIVSDCSAVYCKSGCYLCCVCANKSIANKKRQLKTSCAKKDENDSPLSDDENDSSLSDDENDSSLSDDENDSSLSDDEINKDCCVSCLKYEKKYREMSVGIRKIKVIKLALKKKLSENPEALKLLSSYIALIESTHNIENKI